MVNTGGTMKIILSPAKTLNLTNEVHCDWTISERTKRVVKLLKSLSSKEVKQFLKLSDKLVDEVMQYIKGFDVEMTYKAVEMYHGMAYKSLDVSSLGKNERDYLDEHLLILSALYGVIKPSELIKPYRLDFNSKLKLSRESLRSFWKDDYNASISEGETVLNLASLEFSEILDKGKYDWYDVEFFDLSSGTRKTHSTISKKGRGRLLRELALNDVRTIEGVKQLDGSGVYFSVVE